MLSISTSIVSPCFIQTGGARAAPTPAGVPMMITSPVSSVMHSVRKRWHPWRITSCQRCPLFALRDYLDESQHRVQPCRRAIRRLSRSKVRTPLVVEVFTHRSLRCLALIVVQRHVIESAVAERGLLDGLPHRLVDDDRQFHFVIESRKPYGGRS